jgi:hypothetical protein
MYQDSNKFSVQEQEDYANNHFGMRFENGYSVSIIWHTERTGGIAAMGDGNAAAEIAVFPPGYDDGGKEAEVYGWQTPEQIAAIIADTARLAAPLDAEDAGACDDERG